MKRLVLAVSVAVLGTTFGSSAALACGGLVAPGHAEVLQKATTLAAWHDGLEHYVTAFRFSGSADRFGYIIPLPGVPTKIQKGGDWTLERLEREISPVGFAERTVALKGRAASAVQVLKRVQVAALNITVVRGGGRDVAAWAARNGFDLTPDTPRVLGQYSSAGAVFALARFDREAAERRGLVQGQGSTIHFTIPTRAPWIPLRILALGKVPNERVDADLFVLTDAPPSLQPAVWGSPGTSLRSFGPATAQLLADLRSDRGMAWVPTRGLWLTALTMHTSAASIREDLSIDGGGPPGSAGTVPASPSSGPAWTMWLTVLVGVAGLFTVWALWRPRPALA